MRQTPKRSVNGVLLLNKPQGLSSNAALQKVRRLYRAEKAGHTGVLDPLATGLLPICFGEATKFSRYLLDADKVYIATLKLNHATTTGDAEGDITATIDRNISLQDFQKACNSLIGTIRQIPPMFSAIKHQGKPLYQYARQGITIERKEREIEIYSIDIRQFTPPKVIIAVHCSKGTYIRTLSEDIAQQAGTLAHLTALCRTRTAGFGIEQSSTLETLEALTETERDALLLPCDSLVRHLPEVKLDNRSATMLQQGMRPYFNGNGQLQPLRIYHENGSFIGLAEYRQQHLIAVRLMNTAKAG